MLRPRTHQEFQSRLASGEKFVFRDKPLQDQPLMRLRREGHGIYALMVNDHPEGSTVFIESSGLHVISINMAGIAQDTNLFFVELEFLA